MTPEHGYTISSSCEPEGSGELIKTDFPTVVIAMFLPRSICIIY